MHANHPQTTWRLLLCPPASGAWNMAVDEAIFQAVGRGEAPPTLRLYAWWPPCLSLGYAQPWEEADAARVQARGWEIVRRPTGGRAILHADELTYAVTMPAAHPLARGGVLPAYRRIAQGLLAALRLLGIEAHMEGEHAPSTAPQPVCFEMPSSYEITAGGRKLLGSAQARNGKAVLQHGALPLSGDIARIADALRFPDEAAREAARAKIRRRATTAAESAGREITWQQAAEAFRQGFAEALGLAFRPGVLTAAERRTAVALQTHKYAAPAWTRHRQRPRLPEE